MPRGSATTNRNGKPTNNFISVKMANRRLFKLKRWSRCKRASVSISLLQLAAAHAKMIRRRGRKTVAYYLQLGTYLSLVLFSNSVEQGAAQQPLSTIATDLRDHTPGDNGLCLHATTAEAMHVMLLATHVGLFGAFQTSSRITHDSFHWDQLYFC